MFGALLVAKERKSAPKLAKLGWGLSGGLIAGVLLFLKDAMSFIKTEGWLHWELWLLVGLAIFVAIYGLVLLTQCMKRYDATFSASRMYVLSSSRPRS